MHMFYYLQVSTGVDDLVKWADWDNIWSASSNSKYIIIK